MKIKILGDHSDVHCGCRAVIAAIKEALPQNSAITDGEDFDVLVVNGEGSMHHTSRPCRSKMREISLATEAGKRVYLINSVWQENSPKFDETLKRVEQIVLRETMSREDLIRRHGITAEVHPDLSLQATIDPNADFVDFNERQMMTDFYSKEFAAFVRITDGLLKGVRFVDMKKFEWSSFVRSLSTASLLITGRQHAVMAACKAKVPFVALAGNTHKIEGFVQTSGFNIPVCRDPKEIPNVAAWALKNRGIYDELFEWVETLPKWKLEL